MLGVTVTLLILALISAVLGFSGLATDIAAIAQICFFVFLVLLVISATVNAFKGKSPR
jgi:uncharacterized membrane protein YtjA (UPF0391 family)